MAPLTRPALIFAAATLLGVAACVPRLSHGSPDLVVMSWNIEAGGKGLDSIASVIRTLRPDIVGLQEVDVHWSDRSGFVDQATELARLVGMQVRFAPIYSNAPLEAGRPSRQFGVALLSRYPITAWSNDSIIRLSTQSAAPLPVRMPGLLRATVATGYGRSVRVFVTHLDYRADPVVRRQQASETIGYLRDTDIPTILIGDLNATPDAPELADLFSALDASWRNRSSELPTYPADNPTKRIDYVLASRHFRVLSDTVPAITTADHRPVLTKLQIRSR